MVTTAYARVYSSSVHIACTVYLACFLSLSLLVVSTNRHHTLSVTLASRCGVSFDCINKFACDAKLKRMRAPTDTQYLVPTDRYLSIYMSLLMNTHTHIDTHTYSLFNDAHSYSTHNHTWTQTIANCTWSANYVSQVGNGGNYYNNDGSSSSNSNGGGAMWTYFYDSGHITGGIDTSSVTTQVRKCVRVCVCTVGTDWHTYRRTLFLSVIRFVHIYTIRILIGCIDVYRSVYVRIIWWVVLDSLTLSLSPLFFSSLMFHHLNNVD